jgi:hypothetical protein
LSLLHFLKVVLIDEQIALSMIVRTYNRGQKTKAGKEPLIEKGINTLAAKIVPIDTIHKKMMNIKI